MEEHELHTPGQQSMMSRWHDHSCTNPHVLATRQGSETEIICEICGARPPVDNCVPAQPSYDFAVNDPTDVPPTKRNLRWPDFLPWATRKDDDISDGSALAQRPWGSGKDGSEQDTTRRIDTSSTIYPVRLTRSEFRLACLTASTDEESAPHLTLETYTDNNFPDYEAVSYTWGGEAGDSSLCRRIYIGPYWDILHQTENRWHMLRFLRPRRGIRLVWVDALCINQQDLVERGDQVSKMEQIYRECQRTILYLGPDVSPLLGDRFPRHRELDQIDKDSLTQMLRRRYFSRIWVVQELLLSSSVVIRFGDIEHRVRHPTMERLQKSLRSWKWGDSPAPWLEHMTQGAIRTQDLCYPLHLTANSQCSDPRDRLFEVLSFIDQSDSSLSHRADYSISLQDMWIGFLAHCLMNSSTNWFIHRAIGLSAARNLPSWVPDWVSTNNWNLFRLPPNLNKSVENAFDIVRKSRKIPKEYNIAK